MAWRMLVGRTPFAAESAEDLIRMQAREPVPSIAAVRPDLGVPPELVAAVARACAKDPSERPPSAAALALDLARAVGGAVSRPDPISRPSFQAPQRGTAPPAAPQPRASTATRADRGRSLRVIAVLALVLGLGVAGAALVLHNRSLPPGGAPQAAPVR
jgi:serine/threonine-protein kinase